MKIKQKMINLFIPVLFLIGMIGATVFISAQGVSAACGEAPTSIINCNATSGPNSDITKSGLWEVLLIGINILTGLVGVAVLGGIIYGAVLYTTAGADQGKIQKSIEVFRNVGIGFFTYALMYSGLNFLIPGGVF